MAENTERRFLPHIALDQLRAPIFAVALVVSLATTAVERFRPSFVEPHRHRVFVALDVFFFPLRAVAGTAEGRVDSVRDLYEIEADRDALREELMLTRAKLQFTEEELRRVGRVSGLRRWSGHSELEFVLADVTGFTGDDRRAELILSLGAQDGLEPGMPVVGRGGLAGVIREVTERSARVQALSDPLSAVGVTDLATRSRGVIFGRGRDAALEYIPENETQPIEPGAILITSGFRNSVYPKGIIVGRIERPRSNEHGVRFGAVNPAENLNALEEVLIIRRADRTDVNPLEGLGEFTLEMPATTQATETEPPKSPGESAPDASAASTTKDMEKSESTGESMIELLPTPLTKEPEL